MDEDTKETSVGVPKVHVDRDLCEASGVCERLAPDVFDLGEDDVLQIRRQADSPELRERFELAVRRCPKQALYLE